MVNWVTNNCTILRQTQTPLSAVICDSVRFSLGYAAQRYSGFLITYKRAKGKMRESIYMTSMTLSINANALAHSAIIMYNEENISKFSCRSKKPENFRCSCYLFPELSLYLVRANTKGGDCHKRSKNSEDVL